MKTFKFKYQPITWALLCVVVLLSCIGLLWNIYNVVSFSAIDKVKLSTSVIMCVLCSILLIFTLSVMFYGRYIIKDGLLISHLGLIRSKFEIKDITEITHFKKSDKLVVYYDKDSYIVISISPEFYEKFILAIREYNKSIIYDQRIEGEDMPS